MRIFKSFLLLIVFCFVVISPARAQTQQSTLLWDHQATTVADVNTYTFSITANNTAITATPQCAQVGADVTCGVPIANPTGATTYTVSASKNNITYRASVTVNPATGPKPITSPRYQIIINVGS